MVTEPGFEDVTPLVIEVAGRHDISAALRRAGLPGGRPVLVVVGGADGMSEDEVDTLARLLADGAAPVLEKMGGVVVDGGTNAGVMRAVGRAWKRTSMPRVGVAARGTVRIHGRASPRPDAADPEPFHTHLLLVPGDDWGDESPWIFRVAGAIAEGAPVVTLLANGGEVAYEDVESALGAGGRVVVLAGTGRTADAIADGANGRAAAIAASPATRILRDPILPKLGDYLRRVFEP